MKFMTTAIASALRDVRTALSTAGPLVTGLVLITWILLTFRLLPPVNADYGMFVTVAERLRAGDRLYADVYENKDPLFHYTLALARSITPFGGWLLQIFWVLVCSVATYALAATQGVRERSAVLVSFFAVPLIATGSTFFPGSSHLPAVALMLVLVAALVDERWVIGGIALGAMVLFKLIFIIPGALVLVVMLWRGPRQAAFKTVVVGFLTAAAIIGLMVIRGEFVPYLWTLYDNVAYANGPQGARGVAAIVDHLQRVILVPGTLAMLVATLALVFAVWAVRPRLLSLRPEGQLDVLGWVVVALVAGSFVVVSFTGLWVHHGQVLVPAAVIALVLAAAAFPRVFEGTNVRSMLTVAAVAYLLSALASPTVMLNQLEYGRAIINSQFQIPDSSRLIQSTGTPTSYARIGDGLDDGHAFGLQDWKLACRRFGQSIWEDARVLQETLDCLPRADVIFLTPSVKPDVNDPEWTNFLNGVNRLLSQGYSCVESDAGRACRRVPQS